MKIGDSIGYELKAIYKLLEEGYKMSDIKIGKRNVPSFKYYFDGKLCVYFPDIFIPKEHRIIEVKSTYTYNNWIDRNLAKKDSVLKAGYLFDFYIMEG